MSEIYQPANEVEIAQYVYDCYQASRPIEISTLNTKPIGRSIQCSQTLDLRKNSGIMEYAPEELYIKVKAGTPLLEILEALKKNKQTLGFEPVNLGYLYSGKSNFGSVAGTVSCNLSGPRRFKAGALRDHLLGFTAINGKGESIQSGGTVVKNVTGYDLCKLLSGSFGTLTVLTELSVKVLPKPETSKTLIINNPHVKTALEYLGKSLSSSIDPSGGVFYPDSFEKHFSFNDLIHKGALIGIRVEGPTNSVDQRIKRLSKELDLLENEYSVLNVEQSNIFWKKTKNLEVFSNTEKNLLRVVVPVSETLNFLQKLKNVDLSYFLDWGGSLIWLELNDISIKILNEIKDITKDHNGYFTIIKVEEDMKASADIFTIDPIKYKISEKIKKSFDPKRIFNPGKMYTGI